MKRLKQLRIDRRLDRRQLAAETGVSHETIRRLEQGLVSDPRMDTLGPLADFFDVAPSSLLSDAYPEAA